MVIYTAACEDCLFTLENTCDATVHLVAERHARTQEHEVVYGSYDARYTTSPFHREDAR